MKVYLADTEASSGLTFMFTVDDTPKALQYLNDAGVVVYFADTVPDYVFLDPQWIADIFATIPKMRQFVNRGESCLSWSGKLHKVLILVCY